METCHVVLPPALPVSLDVDFQNESYVIFRMYQL